MSEVLERCCRCGEVLDNGASSYDTDSQPLCRECWQDELADDTE